MDLLEPGSASDSDEDQRRGGVLKPAMVMPPVSSVSMSSFIPHDHCVLPYAQPRPEPYVQEVFYAGNNPIVPGDRTLVGNRPRKKRRKREDGDANLGESHIDGPWVPSSDETFDEEDDEFGGFELPKMPEPVFNLNVREEDDEFGNVLAMSDPNIQPTHTPPAVTKPAPAPITVAPPPASSFVFNMDEDF